MPAGSINRTSSQEKSVDLSARQTLPNAEKSWCLLAARFWPNSGITERHHIITIQPKAS